MSDITVKEAELKIHVENEMHRLLKKYEDATGLRVKSVDLLHLQSPDGYTAIGAVRLNVVMHPRP